MFLIPTLLCPKAWEAMAGDESQRFCSHCKKHVYNLDALSVTERLALLSSPAVSLCSRYKVAIRRATQGNQSSYLRHLMKYGAGVAVTGSVLLVLWEMHNHTEKERYYRAVSSQKDIHDFSHGDDFSDPMPENLYEEHEVYLV